MFTEEILQHLSYTCGCPLDVRKDIGVVNGKCPNHKKSTLLVDGMPIEAYKKFLEKKAKKFDTKSSEIV